VYFDRLLNMAHSIRDDSLQASVQQDDPQPMASFFLVSAFSYAALEGSISSVAWCTNAETKCERILELLENTESTESSSTALEFERDSHRGSQMFIPQTESALWWVVGISTRGMLVVWKVENLENISSPIVTFFASRQAPNWGLQHQAIQSLTGVLGATSDASNAGGCVFHLLYEVGLHACSILVPRV
jgi:hypothetical protein